MDLDGIATGSDLQTVELPYELVEQIVFEAWMDTYQQDSRWKLYNAISRLNRRWREVMQNVSFLFVMVETQEDLIWYRHIIRFATRFNNSPFERNIFSLAHIHATYDLLHFVGSLFPDCTRLEIRVPARPYSSSPMVMIGSRQPSQMSTKHIFPGNFHSLSHVIVNWQSEVTIFSPSFGYQALPITTVRTLSFCYPAEYRPHGVKVIIQYLSEVFPEVTTLRMQGPFPLTEIAGFFQKVEVVLLDTPPGASSPSGTVTMPLRVPSQNNQTSESGRPRMASVAVLAMSLSVRWTISAAVRSRAMESLKRIVFLGCPEKPSNWSWMSQVCREHGVDLDYRVAYDTVG